MTSTGAPVAELQDALPAASLVTDPDLMESYRRDNADLAEAGMPLAVVLARSAEEVSVALRWATAHRVPVVPRGAGSGLSGGASAIEGGLILSLVHMDHI